MQDERLKEITNKINETLGDETSATIAGEIGLLFTENQQVMQNLKEKDEKIAELKKLNEKLVISNGTLLKQVPMGKEEPPKESEKEVHKSINFKDCFDEFGNFKK